MQMASSWSSLKTTDFEGSILFWSLHFMHVSKYCMILSSILLPVRYFAHSRYLNLQPIGLDLQKKYHSANKTILTDKLNWIVIDFLTFWKIVLSIWTQFLIPIRPSSWRKWTNNVIFIKIIILSKKFVPTLGNWGFRQRCLLHT